MSSNIRLGRIAGVPISAHWSVLGMAAFVVYSLAFTVLPSLYPTAPLLDRLMAASACAFLFVLSILGHELGHAFLAKRSRHKGGRHQPLDSGWSSQTQPPSQNPKGRIRDRSCWATCQHVDRRLDFLAPLSSPGPKTLLDRVLPLSPGWES